MNYAELIEKAQEKLAESQADVEAIMSRMEAEERDLTEDEDAELTVLTDEITGLKTKLDQLERAEKASAMRQAAKAPGIVKHAGSGRDRPKGDLVFKHATAAFIAHVQGKNLEQVVRERYAHDPELAAVVKTAVSPASTEQAGWAAELVDSATRGFQDLLRGESAAARVFARAGISLDFDGFNAIKVPGRRGGKTDLASSWTGENDAIPVKRTTFGSQTLNPYKWGVISTFSKELAARSNPSIEGLLRSFIIQDTADQLDANFFDAAAAIAGVRPAGILNGVTGTASGGATAPDITADLRALLGPILAADMGRSLVILMNPTNGLALSSILTATGVYLFRDELASGTLHGIPVIQSTNIPVGVLIALDCAELAVAQSASMFEVSDTATLVEVNDDGTQPNMTADVHPRAPDSGQVGDAARDTTNNPPIRSLFQTHAVGIKHVQYIAWALMRAGAVNQITGVSY